MRSNIKHFLECIIEDYDNNKTYQTGVSGNENFSTIEIFLSYILYVSKQASFRFELATIRA